jgi:hypothetical protein
LLVGRRERNNGVSDDTEAKVSLNPSKGQLPDPLVVLLEEHAQIGT